MVCQPFKAQSPWLKKYAARFDKINYPDPVFRAISKHLVKAGHRAEAYRREAAHYCRERAAGGSEQQGVLDGNQGHATFIKLGRQEAIGTVDGSGSPRRPAIGAENGADVLFAVDRQSMHVSSSTLRIAQRRTFDVDGVAVVAEPAEQSFDHGLSAKEVVPLIILEIGGDDRGVADIAAPLA